MTKTTISLPEELKRQLENAARLEGRTQAEIIREAIEEAMRKRVRPRPTLPLTTLGLRRSDIAERVDEYLQGFGED
jgi:Arc/MetJ-type ribon-helix-helix transcriptional regulator